MPLTSTSPLRRGLAGPRAVRVVYPRIESWELWRHRQARSGDEPVAQAEEVAPLATLDPVGLSQINDIPEVGKPVATLSLPVGEVQTIDWPASDFNVSATQEFDTALKGNHAVQREVTRGTMVSVLPVSGVDMEDRPASVRSRAFARTEVAGLDEPFGDRPGLAPASREEGGPVGPSGFATSVLPSLTAEHLTPEGERWLKSLPVSVRPLLTAKRHPHIVNKMARLWDRRDALGAYMDELLISSRPGRRGFAMEVLEELVDLQRALQERGRI